MTSAVMTHFGRGKEFVEKIFENPETEELNDFRVFGQHRDPYEVRKKQCSVT